MAWRFTFDCVDPNCHFEGTYEEIQQHKASGYCPYLPEQHQSSNDDSMGMQQLHEVLIEEVNMDPLAALPPDPVAHGFQIESITFFDGISGDEICSVSAMGDLTGEIHVRLPMQLALQTCVTREIAFTSVEEICDLWLVERLLYEEELVVERRFAVGYVIPGSTNTWSQLVVEDGSSTTLPNVYEQANSIVVEVRFFDGEVYLATKRLHVVYVEVL